MAIRKNVKKASISSKKVKVKSAKLYRRPTSKLTKQISKKRAVSKTIKSKKPVAKTVVRSTKKPVSKISSVLTSIKKILTAEGWKRMMMRDRKAIKH